MRGAHRLRATEALRKVGPSPRAWGSRPDRLRHGHPRRSIPTCVGLTPSGPGRPGAQAVHPHVRGAHSSMMPSKHGGAWSIPTCVGLTGTPRPGGGTPAVHPHVRGAHGGSGMRGGGKAGPSPRAWGSRSPSREAAGLLRSIPTCVGLTRQCPRVCAHSAVHPHVRGAHQELTQKTLDLIGPSPRAWGSPNDSRPRTGPRGPSPRAWGSPADPGPRRPGQRSIPTCVGLTNRPPPTPERALVHPHVRGAH